VTTNERAKETERSRTRVEAVARFSTSSQEIGMVLSRRDFLIGGGATAAATLGGPSRLLAAVAKHTPPPADLSTWPAVRAQFALAPGYAHFSSFFLASHPKPVRDAIESYRRAIDENPYLFVEHSISEEAANLQIAACRAMSGYLGARPEEIALTPNTTTGLALVYHGLTLAPGDELLLTTHDHYSHHESARLAALRSSAKIRRIALYDRPADASVETIASRVRAAIRPSTRVLGVTWVHSSTGVRLPVREIAMAVREANRNRDEKHRVQLVVDGVHGLGSTDETIAEMGCDFFCAGTHKWMFGPRGTGIVWAKPEAWARLRPLIPTFSTWDAFRAWMDEKAPGPTTAALATPGGFLPFEHQWAVAEAFRFHERIGKRRVAARIRELNDRMKEGLAAVPGLTLHTPRDPVLSAGLVCFEIGGHAPEDIVRALLARKIVASASPYKVSYARLAPSLVNDAREVDDAVRAVRAIAAT
jgi:selenocysteine lyase/cysteine desulfurase